MTADRVLVTGAAGLVGRAVVDALVAQGRSVVACSRRAVDLPGGVTVLEVDLADPSAPAALANVGAIDGIIHCAASLPASPDEPAEGVAAMNRAIDSAALTVSEALQARLVACSSISVYGFSARGLVSETTVPDPPNAYAAGKLASEALFAALASHAILRLSSPYGPKMKRPTVLSLFARRAVAGEALQYHGSGERSQDFVHVADVAEACIRALDSRSENILVNICSAEAVSMRSLALLVARQAGLPQNVVGPSDQPDPQESFRARYDRSRAGELLGWRPRTTLESGVRQLIAALRAEDGR